MKPEQLIIIGAILLISSFLLSFMMVLRVIEPDLFTSLAAVFFSVLGLGLGYAGITGYVGKKKSGEKQ